MALLVGSAVPALRSTAFASFARPANTTAYTAGDVVSNSATTTVMMKFPLARAAGGGGYVVKAQLDTNSKTFLSQVRLYLFSRTDLVIVAADNVAGTVNYADAPYRIGYIDFPLLATGAGAGSTGSMALFTGNVEFQCEDQDDAIYGYLVDNTGSTPTSAQIFGVRLFADIY